MLFNLLSTCGLNESEQKVFLCLLGRGSTLGSVIARQTGLKRPTVYAILENLVRLGIVVKQKRNKVTYFNALPPEMITSTFENKARKKFTDIQTASKMLIGPLQQISKKATHDVGGGFEIIAIDSAANMYSQLEDSQLGGGFCAIFNPEKALRPAACQKAAKKFLQKTSQTTPHIREIMLMGEMANWYKDHIKNPNHLTKEIPLEKYLLSDMICVNDTVFLCHYHPHQEVGVRIVHPDFYASMMTIFEMLWERL